MKKILFVISTLQRTGPTNQLFNLIKNICCMYNVEVVTLSPEPSNSRWNDFDELDIRLTSLNLSRVSGLLFAKKKLENYISESNPFLIHSQGFRSDVIISKINTPVKKIATVHNIPQEDYRMTYGAFWGALMYRRHAEALRLFDQCIAVSKSVSNNALNIIKVKKCSVVFNGVNTDIFRPDSSQRYFLREELGLSMDATIWITSGNISTLKRPFDIIDAFSKNYSHKDNIHLILLGDGPLKIILEQEYKNIQNVHFLGRVDDVARYLQGSDFFCSPSSSEGLPMAVIEAMACGLPVLLSNIPAHLELFGIDEGIGVSYAVGNVELLSNKLKDMMSFDYSVMSNHSVSVVSKYLSDVVMSTGYIETYNAFKVN